jgi:hypothetical protein
VAHCVQPPWFECAFRGCEILVHKNLFRSKKQLQSHARHWHNRTSESSNLNDSPTYHSIEEVDGTQESAELDGTQEVSACRSPADPESYIQGYHQPQIYQQRRQPSHHQNEPGDSRIGQD